MLTQLVVPSVLLATSALAAPSLTQLVARQSSGNSSSSGTSSSNSSSLPTLKILQGGYNSTYGILEFNPYADPPTLRVLDYYNTTEGNLKPWLNRHPINPSIVIGCNDHAVPNAPGYLTSYSLDDTTGQLTYIDSVDAGGFPTQNYSVATAHCAFFPDGRVAAAANYFGQSASTFRFNPENGTFGERINQQILEFPGYTPVQGQIGVAGNDDTSQATSHPHQIVTHPWLPVFYLPDLGEDLLRLYSIGPDGTLTNLTQYQQPYGSGPRHMAISSNGQHAYVLHELAANIRPLSINQQTGELTQIQDDQPIYNVENTTFSLNISAAEVHVSNDGRFLYASQRNLTNAALIQPGDPSDFIAVWSIDPASGSIQRIQSAMAMGSRQIRSFELSPAGTTASAGGEDFIVAGSLRTNETFVYRRDKANGTLSVVAQVGNTYQPATYLWLQ